MKAQVSTEDARGGETPPPAAANEAAGDDSIAAGQPLSDDDEDVFKEIPTVANRANLVSAAGEQNANGVASPSSREGAGAYRILRPTTSDFVADPVVTKIADDPGKQNPARCVILGAARKPR